MDPIFLATLVGGVCLGLVAWSLGRSQIEQQSKPQGKSSSDNGESSDSGEESSSGDGESANSGEESSSVDSESSDGGEESSSSDGESSDSGEESSSGDGESSDSGEESSSGDGESSDSGEESSSGDGESADSGEESSSGDGESSDSGEESSSGDGESSDSGEESSSGDGESSDGGDNSQAPASETDEKQKSLSSEDAAIADRSKEDIEEALKSLDLNKLLQEAGLKQGAYNKQTLGNLKIPVMQKFEKIERDMDVLNSLRGKIKPLSDQLRKYLQHCGTDQKVEHDCLIGPQIQSNVYEAQWGNFRFFEDKEDTPLANVDIQLIIDCSGSMGDRNSGKMQLAIAFGLLLDMAMSNLRGVSGRIWGFNDEMYDCGKPGDFRVTGLEAKGTTNEAGALFHAYTYSRKSNKKLRLLVMISDGGPDDWNALKRVVTKVEREGIIPIQIGIGAIANTAYSKRYFVDLSTAKNMQHAVIKFGQLLISLVAVFQKK